MIRRPLAAAPLIALCLSAGAAFAAPPGFAFLEIPSSARLSGLGGAGMTLAEGVEAAYWNPAELERAKGIEISASHFELYQSLRNEEFAVAGQLFGGGIAASFRALYSEPIEERDDLGNLIGTFGSHDLEFALGYGAAFEGGVRAGVAAQIVRERIADKAAQTWGLHAGASWDVPRWPNLRLALAARNLGPAAAYTIDGVRGADVGLPAAIQGGASYRWSVGSSNTLRGALESRVTRGRSGIACMGAEFSNPSGAALRAGLRVNDDVSTFAAGAGYRVQGVLIDYAFVPSRLDLEDTHRVSLSARF